MIIKSSLHKTVAIVLWLTLSFLSLAQTPNTLGNWGMLFNQVRIYDNWSFHSEVQYRSFELTPNTEQLLLRGAINYHLNKDYSASAGYAYVTNYSFDKELMPRVRVFENRIWQQFTIRNNISTWLLDHRYRTEQRWLDLGNSTRYLNRIRYMLRVTVPLNKKEMVKNTLFVSFYDEIFIHFSDVPFDRNRLYGAIGYHFLANANLQLGVLAQTVNTSTKHYLQAALFYNIDLREKD